MDAIKELVQRYPQLTALEDKVRAAADMIIDCYRRGGTVYTVGNGGSAADASHIVGEFMKAFVKPRPVPSEDVEAFKGCPDGDYLSSRLQCGFRAISLVTQEGITTAVQNDQGWDLGPAQELYSLARKGDVLIGISTSGNARNVHLACQVAKVRGVGIIGLAGKDGGLLAKDSDVAIVVPERETYKIQEFHLPIYHAICIAVEDAFF